MSEVSTVFARSTRKIVDAVAARADTRHLLRAVGLDREAIDDPSLRIPYADMMMLSEHAARMTGDAAFGLHVGERVEQQEYGIVGAAVMTSATLGDALHTLVCYLPLWTNVGSFKLEVDKTIAHFQWQFSDRSLPEPHHDCEMTMATVARFDRFSDLRWRPREVWFQHAKPKIIDEHARIFRAPVRFGMPANSILMDRELLELPLHTADPVSHARAIEGAEQLLAGTCHQVTLSQSVLSFIRQNLGSGDFDVQAAARHFGVSRRTLQRKLTEESRSYRELVQQARQDLTQYLLLGVDRTATETAYALGYSEPSVFHRAFQRWHGTPPGKYRGEAQGD
jgi:AraC-like DNA-binding protein